jgi:8-oxo-dGTP pyrophosphatase MutT (NUDIX family)
MTAFAQSTLGRLRAAMGKGALLCPCVRIIIEREDGGVLMHARADFTGMWGLPGGHMEIGESAQQAASREMLEETGLQAERMDIFGYASDPTLETVTLPNGDVCQYHAVLFHCGSYSGELQADPAEAPATQWVQPSGQLPSMMPHVRATLQAFLRFRTGQGFQLY